MSQNNSGELTEIQLVVFKLGSEEYGVPITQVQEINRLMTPTKIPQSPPFVEGIINLRGKIIPVIDLKKRFNLPLVDHTANTRIIVINIGENTVGVVVDAVTEVLRLPMSSLEPPPPMISSISVDYLKGVGKVGDRLLILLDLDKILTEKEKEQLAATEACAKDTVKF
ncbi:chemotaxis protein CheW [Heliorestis acidaminivorans]|uniref:Chemotaxis protein CheW n=1 Tax=Heliorestis acidaminivorans TaxID=553427 RepID=A0A6I0ESI9_9FIRM|nr:chemotaxis protein CheW [Heliorestis acidaminivorans]KAB2951832.1 chemotaxis protein CheW [Heliorestis acidaminivorans]